MSSPLAYFILGAAGSGRRSVVGDLAANGLDTSERPALLEPEGEKSPSPETLAQVGQVPHLRRATWTLGPDGRISHSAPADTTHLFLLADGRANPVDQIEALHAWLPSSGYELARIITVVSCRLASAHHELLRWFDACVHFSDVVLLTHREGVPNKWISDFLGRYRKQHFPCLIEYVKKGEVANPALILEPQARRMSMLFDAPETWPSTAPDGAEDDEGASGPEDAGAADLIGGVDPWLERQAASGRRARELPDIAKFLTA